MIWLKLKAGALQLTLFIVVVIALLLASFLILVHTHKRFNIQTDFVIETIDNANRGINYSLNNSIKLNDTTSINLNDEDYKTLKIHRDFWGLFEKVTSTSSIKNKTIQKAALIGATQQKINQTVLYVEDNNKPLVLVGDTRIEGLAYLPKRGIKTGNISGHSYYGSQLIYGQSKTANKLPTLLTETNQHIKTVYNQFTTLKNDQQRIELQSGEAYSNSFLKPLKYVLNSGTITLRNIQLIGHIVVQSKTKIIIEPSAKLKDVILIAPEIEINNNVIATFQSFATKTIKVGKNCSLNYPSALVLKEKTTVSTESSTPTSQETNNIIIDENSTIKGVVVYQGQSKTNNYKPQIVLENNASVLGEVYCTQNLELKGSVFGSVFTSNFIANQFGSVYQNHLYNATINVNELPKEYVGLTFNSTKGKGVLKWLY